MQKIKMHKRWLKRNPDLNGQSDTFSNLFVFGYSCKLFRDDEKAMFIERGDHLISWLDLPHMKIDRFDVIGTIYDENKLNEFLKILPNVNVSKEDKEIEELCEIERYRDLKENEKVESPKREFYYNYGTNNQSSVEDDLYEKPVSLNLPENIAVPKTMKEHTRIEKTAFFIKNNGIQMEILLKTKQAKNPQFGFMTSGHELFPYYKFLLESFKNGSYSINLGESQEIDSAKTVADNSEVLITGKLPATQFNKLTVPQLTPVVSKPNFVPDNDNPFSQILNRLNGQIKATKQSISLPSAVNADKSLSLISQYSDSDSESDNDKDLNKNNPESCELDSTLTDGVRLIIDKMALYVAKNGPEFENIVRSKGDQRFLFLHPSHPFHSYYLERRNTELLSSLSNVYVPEAVYIPPPPPPPPPLDEKNEPTSVKIGPISFSIKKISEPNIVTSVVTNDDNLKNEPLTQPEPLARTESSSTNNDELWEDVIMEFIDSTKKNPAQDKELQLVRKRRAEEFLNKLKRAKEDSHTDDDDDDEVIELYVKHKSKRHHKDKKCKNKEKHKDKDRVKKGKSCKKHKHSSKDKKDKKRARRKHSD